MAVTTLVRRRKGRSSYAVRREYTGTCVRARTRSHLWSPSYFAASAAGAPLSAITRYIENQERPLQPRATPTSLVYPPSYFVPDWRDRLDTAATAGGASFYVSGIFPGFASDELALLLTTQSKNIRTITASEVALNDHYPVADVMMDGMGFGRPLDFEPLLSTPGFVEMAWKAAIYLMATGLGVEVQAPGPRAWSTAARRS